LPQYM